MKNLGEIFLEKAKYKHGEKYDYSKVEYVNNCSKISIICPIHGGFIQTPQGHLNTRGCSKCSLLQSTINQSSNTKNFIEKAIALHGDKYNYDKVDYINNHTNVTIKCYLHGDFEQKPSNHLINRGCYFCGRERIKNYNSKNTSGWNNSTWRNSAELSKKYDSYKLYLIECSDDNEKFYKIGKTFRKV